jgi:hypothetical protein
MSGHEEDVARRPRAEFTLPLGEHWVVRYVLEVHDGVAVVAELHVGPARPSHRPKRGKEPGKITWESDPAYMPARGLTARDLRRIPLGPEVTARAFKPQLQRLWDAKTGEAVYCEPPPFFSQAVTAARKNARGYGRSDRFYAEIATKYVKAVQAGSGRPIQDIADELKASGQPFAPETIRIFRRTAIKRGLLSRSPRPGVPGGRLTERAEELLRDADDGSA